MNREKRIGIGVEREKSNERGKPNIKTSKNSIDFTISENSTDFNLTKKYRHLWVQCENCCGLNYKKIFKSKMNICEQCGYHLKMNSSDRIELSIDPGTWNPMDEDMVLILYQGILRMIQIELIGCPTCGLYDITDQ